MSAVEKREVSTFEAHAILILVVPPSKKIRGALQAIVISLMMMMMPISHSLRCIYLNAYKHSLSGLNAHTKRKDWLLQYFSADSA